MIINTEYQSDDREYKKFAKIEELVTLLNNGEDVPVVVSETGNQVLLADDGDIAILVDEYSGITVEKIGTVREREAFDEEHGPFEALDPKTKLTFSNTDEEAYK